MPFPRIAVIALLILGVLVLPLPAQAAGGTYVVKPGDTLGDIAAANGTTAAALQRANGLNNGNSLRPGQKLAIPGGTSTAGAAPATQTAEGGRQYVVKAGDTLGDIAAKFGVSSAAVKAANGLQSANVLRLGATLIIPGSSGSASSAGSSAASSSSATTSRSRSSAADAGEKAYLYNKYGGGPAELQPDRFAVSVSAQHCWLIENHEVIGSWPCSTGRKGYATPTGFYRVQSKYRDVYGSQWNFYMPYWLGIYSIDGYENGIHGLPYNKWGKDWEDEIGNPISFGCIVLQDAAAKMVYDAAYIGFQVLIIK